MGIIERIRDRQREEASRETTEEAVSQAEAKRQAEEERQLQQENLKKTKQILEESGVMTCLKEIKDRFTGRGLFGFKKGELRHIEVETGSQVLVKGKVDPREPNPEPIGGVELIWDQKQTRVEFAKDQGKRWKAMRVLVTESGDLLLETKEVTQRYLGVAISSLYPSETITVYEIISREDWEKGGELVEKMLADYYLNPLEEISPPTNYLHGPPDIPTVRISKL